MKGKQLPFWEDFSEGVSQTMGVFFRPVLNPGSGQTNYPPCFWLAFSSCCVAGKSDCWNMSFLRALHRNKTSLQPLLLSSSRLKTRSSGRASSPSGQEDSSITLLASFTKYLMDRNARCEIYVSILYCPLQILPTMLKRLGIFCCQGGPIYT